MASVSASIADFRLVSTWYNGSGGAITSGPSTDSQTKVFTISGIPEDVTIDSAVLSLTMGSPYTGASILRVNGESTTPGTKSFDLEPTETGNGDYSIAFVFQANGAAGLSTGEHRGVIAVTDAAVTVTYTGAPPGPEPEPEPDLDWEGDKPISVFAANKVDRFGNNGLAILTPTEGRLHMVAGGACEVTMKHPIDPEGKWAYLVPGAIIRCPVPAETIENAFIGIDVDVYKTTASAALREGMSEPTVISYEEFDAAHIPRYTVGDRCTVSFMDKNYELYQDYDFVYAPTPYNNPEYWKTISRYTTGSPILVQLSAGAELYFLEDMGNGWYYMSTPMGVEGYIRSSRVTFDRHITPEESGEQVIRDQLFRIKNVSVDTRNMEATVYAAHVSYDLSAILVKEVSLSKASPSMAITRIMDALMMPYRGSVATNLTTDENGTYTGAINGKNGIFALLDPDAGIVPTFKARYTRNNWDLYILKDRKRDRGVWMAYGKNVRGITWKRSDESLVTRVVPVAKDTKGADLYLPENYVDSPNINDYPVIMMQRLAVRGQLGKDDGTGTNTKWTSETLFAEMRAKAEERYTVDHADEIRVEITVDFEQLGDSVEYSWLKGLEQVCLYDTVHAMDERIGLETALQVTEIDWDIIRRKITGVKVATGTDYGLATVAGYNMSNNSIGIEKLTEAAVQEIANLNS